MAQLTAGAIVVFALIGVALVLFVAEWLPPDMTAVGVLVALAVLEPLTGVTATDAIAGFASPAVVTILAMYVLSAAVERVGVVDVLGYHLARYTRGDEDRMLVATSATTGLSAGFVNNTPVVAMFVPLVTGLADDHGISPSRLLMPLSFAAMLGGTLTLIGTSTNLLASDIARELLGEPLSMFQFTAVGGLGLLVGLLYLFSVGKRLVPARLDPDADDLETYDLDRHLTRLVVREGSPLVGHTVAETLDAKPNGFPLADDRERDLRVDADPNDIATASEAIDVDVLQIDRDGETFLATATDRPVAVDDVLTVRGNEQETNRFAETFWLRELHREQLRDDVLEGADHEGLIAEAVVHPESRLEHRTVADLAMRERFDATVLSVRRGGESVTDELEEFVLETGDTLLLQAPASSLEYFEEEGYLVVTDAPEAYLGNKPGAGPPSLDPNAPLAIGILAGVVVVAALGLLPIYIAALGGVVLAVASRTLTASKAYDSVSWDVIFLLAGLLPLGIAMQQTGSAAFLGALLVEYGAGLHPIALMGVCYLATVLVASAITPVATVVLLLPIAVETAEGIGANGLPFLLVVTLAASHAFLTPIGYQTNLMVYGPGRYRFTDFARVGLPLVLLLAPVTTVGVALLFPP